MQATSYEFFIDIVEVIREGNGFFMHLLRVLIQPVHRRTSTDNQPRPATAHSARLNPDGWLKRLCC
jgi:hypothetical protein